MPSLTGRFPLQRGDQFGALSLRRLRLVHTPCPGGRADTCTTTCGAVRFLVTSLCCNGIRRWSRRPRSGSHEGVFDTNTEIAATAPGNNLARGFPAENAVSPREEAPSLQPRRGSSNFRRQALPKGIGVGGFGQSTDGCAKLVARELE